MTLVHLPRWDLQGITVDGVRFHSGSDRAGVFIVTENGLQGWDDGVDIRREDSAIPQAHGAFDVPGFQDARVVTISGTVKARTHRDLMVMRNRLTGILAGGQSGPLAVARTEGTQTATVRLAAKPTFAQLDDTTAEFAIQFWAPDPRKFGDARRYRALWVEEPEEQYQNAVLLAQYGNFEGLPVIIVNGSFPGGYRIDGPAGKAFIVNVPLFDSLTHVIDFNTGYLAIDGRIISGAVSRADTWPVPANGRAAVYRITALAGGQGAADFEVRDTYI